VQYILLIYGTESSWINMPEEQMKAFYGQYMEYGRAMTEAGVVRGGHELKPVAMATTVRVVDGKTVATDGPFAETKEQLGGYYIIETENLEQAIEWAAKCPSAPFGSIEVRPLVQHG
jgi:hypothetical protein